MAVFAPRFTITNAITAGLTAIERARRLNTRQAGALDHLLAHGKLTLADLQSIFPAVNRRTLQRDLKAMLDKGMLREVATGPTDPNRHYVLGEL